MKLKTGNQQRKINEPKATFFEKFNQTEISQAKKKIKWTQMSMIRNERGRHHYRSHGHCKDNKRIL